MGGYNYLCVCVGGYNYLCVCVCGGGAITTCVCVCVCVGGGAITMCVCVGGYNYLCVCVWGGGGRHYNFMYVCSLGIAKLNLVPEPHILNHNPLRTLRLSFQNAHSLQLRATDNSKD